MQDKPTSLIKENKKSSLNATLEALYEYLLTCPEFLALAGKTQVLNVGVSKPELDLTTRIIHDRQVSKNAAKIAKIIGIDEYGIIMSQIAGLAHDIGHMPFGHDGESSIINELRKFGKGYIFRHEQYGAEILEKIINRFYYQSKKEGNTTNKFDHQSNQEGKINPEYLILAKFELERAVRNHSQYYGFKVDKETKVEQSVRLADTISFMATDLSDLLKAYTVDGTEKIVPQQVLIDELNQISGMTNDIIEHVMPMIDTLIHGSLDEIEHLQEDLIKEAFSLTRKGDVQCTIVDDIKLEQDIVSSIEENRRRRGIGSGTRALKSILNYYGYLLEKNSLAEPNVEFLQLIEDIIGSQKPLDCYRKLSDLYDVLRDEKGTDLTSEQMSIIEKFSRDKFKQIRDVAQTHSSELISRDLKLYPRLITVFMLQNSLQYEKILKQNPERLGNTALMYTDLDGNRYQKNTRELISEKFQSVLKMAYAVYSNPKEYTIDGQKPNLKRYNSNSVPCCGGIVYEPLRFTIFAIQQMSNKDFKNDEINLHIAEQLHIKPEKLKEIQNIDMEKIYNSAISPKQLLVNGKVLPINKESMVVVRGRYNLTRPRYRFRRMNYSAMTVDEFKKTDEDTQKSVLSQIESDMKQTQREKYDDDEGR